MPEMRSATSDWASATSRSRSPSLPSDDVSAKSSGRDRAWQSDETAWQRAGKKSLPDQAGTRRPTLRLAVFVTNVPAP